MFRQILLKEYHKMKRLWLLLLLLNLAVSVKMVVDVRALFLADHAEIVWYRVLQLGQLYCDQLRFVPLVSGIFVGLIQFLPEMQGGRLRLALHLPITPQRMIFTHLAAGGFALGLALLPDMVLLTWVSWQRFPPQWSVTLFSTVLPWFLAGVAAYLGSALVLLEPELRCKGGNALLSAGVCGCYLVVLSPGAWQNEVWLLFLPILLLIPSVLSPVFHYRYRRVD